jgi:hypothetical protein
MINSKDDEQLRSIIRSRLLDYTVADVTAERAKLVAEWRKHHPEAAQETSPAHRPLDLKSQKQSGAPADAPDEVWNNDVYSVNVRFKPDRVFGTREGMIQLGISALNGAARHDWREFQAIKNQLAGVECEAFELYPAESRLLDPSNYYTLWCFPGVKRLKVGMDEGRRQWDADEALAPQRGIAKGARPAD